MKNSKIALSDITFDRQEEKAVLSVLRSRWLSMGQECEQLEKEFASYVGKKYALVVTNGTAGLHLAFTALGVGEGDEVIVPSLTFVATANAVRYTGATPVFADINSLDDWTISPSEIKKKITDRTKAIGVVHYAGYPCKMNEIKAIAKTHNLYIVEDASHGPGSYYNGRQIGTFGDIGCFSFFANKNMVTGEGGMVVTGSNEIAKRIRYLRSQGMSSISWERDKGHAASYDVSMLGYNYRFDEIRAALGRVQLKKLARSNKKRTELYTHYVERLKTIPEIKIPFSKCTETVSHHIFPVLLDRKVERDKLRESMAKCNIQTSVHYQPVHLMSIYQDLNMAKLPLTETVAKQELTLPLHPLLEFRDVRKVAEAVSQCLSGGINKSEN